MTAFKNGLYVGVLNAANGTEVWQILTSNFIPNVKKDQTSTGVIMGLSNQTAP